MCQCEEGWGDSGARSRPLTHCLHADTGSLWPRSFMPHAISLHVQNRAAKTYHEFLQGDTPRIRTLKNSLSFIVDVPQPPKSRVSNQKAQLVPYICSHHPHATPPIRRASQQPASKYVTSSPATHAHSRPHAVPTSPPDINAAILGKHARNHHPSTPPIHPRSTRANSSRRVRKNVYEPSTASTAA